MAISTEGKIGIALGLLGLLGAGAIMVAPTQLLIGWSMIAVSVIGAIWLLFSHFENWRNRITPAIGAMMLGVTFLGWIVWYFGPNVHAKLEQATAQIPIELPDVTLKLTSKKSPMIVLTNISNKVAQNIKWSVWLWNLDDQKMKATKEPTEASEFPQPLQIPTQTFDFIRPHSFGGPMILFVSPAVSSKVKVGDRLMGSASVVCPDCARGHTYIVYIVLGEGGWFYELNSETSGYPRVPEHVSIEGIKQFSAAALESIKEQDRIVITDSR
jgi:hypothetical protein